MEDTATSEGRIKVLKTEISKEGDISQSALTITISDDIKSLLTQAKNLTAQSTENHKQFESKIKSILCPICQKGELFAVSRDKVFGLVSDKWLICNECGAEFEKKVEKAKLIRASGDPYGIYKKYANQTLSLKEWSEIGETRITKESSENKEEELSRIKAKICNLLLQEFLAGTLKLFFTDIGGFILKKAEIPLFATIAEVIEERKRRISHRTTYGGVRGYGGFSFRIAKGVWGHVGASAPISPSVSTLQSTEYTELVAVDMGDFLITNQRLLFRGRSRGFATPLNKVVAVNIDPDEEGLMITQENKKPSILKLKIPDTAQLDGVELPFSIGIENIVDIIEVGETGENRIAATFKKPMRRIPCRDGNCIGTINENGVCSVCGKQYLLETF